MVPDRRLFGEGKGLPVPGKLISSAAWLSTSAACVTLNCCLAVRI